MIKNIYYCCLLILTTTYSFSQSTVRASFGYGLPMNSELIMVQVREGYDNNFYRKVKAIYGSYGSGFRFNIAFARPIKKGSSFSWDIENTLILGKKYISRSIYNNGVETPERTETHSLAYQITPSLVYGFKWKTLTPYVRIGPTFSVAKLITDVRLLTTNFLEVEYSYEYKGGVGLGMKSTIGTAMQLSPKISIIGEISFLSMTYGPKKGWLTKYDVEGSSELDQFSNKDRTIKFEKEYSIDPNDPESQTINTRDRYAMGYVSLNVGAKFTF
ncbi:MAG: hypothetical protein JNK18_12410 [Cyclobacteriaceae bacterium]|nr:hypothetical protein [Cyclobacteriaceae bacterium]